MLIDYKPDYQKITMGLLSLIPDLKETKHLTAELDWYLKEDNRHLYIWKSEETGDMVGVLGVEEEQGLVLLRHIALNPSYRHEGITYKMLDALSKKAPGKKIMGTLETSAIVSKWQKYTADKRIENSDELEEPQDNERFSNMSEPPQLTEQGTEE